jgi:hypothetical protein
VDVVLNCFRRDLGKRKLTEYRPKVFGCIEILLVRFLGPEGWLRTGFQIPIKPRSESKLS